MDKISTFEQFLQTQSVAIPVFGFILNLVMTAFLSYLLGLLYSSHGRSLSNRQSFSKNFILIAVTAMIIITIVKSSLALSLGLVGALSIVRFRAAIKEPEELSYIFLTIALGLGFGANQRLVTVIGFVFVVVLIYLSGKLFRNTSIQNINLLISKNNPDDKSLEEIVDIVNSFTLSNDLKRLDRNVDLLEGTFFIEIENYNQIELMQQKLIEYCPSIKITYLDNIGVG